MSNECRICRKMTKEKYKSYNKWKALAVVFMILTAILSALYFSSGDMFKETVMEYNNQVEIENGGDNNTNAQNGNITIETQTDNYSTVAVVIVSILFIGGVAFGCYAFSQIRLQNKQQGDDNKRKEE